MKTSKVAKNAQARKKAEEQKAKKKLARKSGESMATPTQGKKGKSLVPQSKKKK